MINNVLTYEDLYFAILTFCLFFQGFYFGRRQMWRVLIISLLLLVSSAISIVLHGIYTLDMTIYEIIMGIMYALLLWWIGYKMSRVIVVKEGDIGIVKRLNINDKEKMT